MSKTDKITSVWSDLFRRSRLSYHNTKDNREIWHTYISPINILITFIVSIIIIFALVLTIVAYSPIMENLPGYRSDALRSREEIMDNIIRLDSMERVIDYMMTYNENIAQIMDGKRVEVEQHIEAKSSRESQDIIAPNSADSALRLQMEGAGRYNVRLAEVLAGAPIIKPINGVITRSFDISQEHFGVEITAAAGEKVLALQDGVVMLSNWQPDGGYMVSILHSDNLISIYQNLAETIVRRGEVVKGGEVIGYNSEELMGEDGKRHVISLTIGLEIWNNGTPIDPERIITF